MDIIDAIMQKNMEILVKLLDEGADPNWTEDSEQITPLHFAVVYNFPEAIPVLLKAGADPNKKDNGGMSAHMLALHFEDQLCIESFAAYG